MIPPKVAGFLRKARMASDLAERVRQADSYAEVAELASEAGEPASQEELRAVFMERNAGVLLEQMMRRGMIARVPLPPVPPLDQDLWSRIAAIDLTPVADQLVTYLGWTEARTASIERRYRRFLYLKATLPNGNASPSPEVDEFWHQHIINTRRYGPDCQRAAGRFLHHTFLSPGDAADSAELTATWLATKACYERLFAEPYEETLGAALLDRWPAC